MEYLTIKDAIKVWGIDRHTIQKLMPTIEGWRVLGGVILLPATRPEPFTLTCSVCGGGFESYNESDIFCSKKCENYQQEQEIVQPVYAPSIAVISGIDVPDWVPGDINRDKFCINCGGVYHNNFHWSKYCKPECRREFNKKHDIKNSERYCPLCKTVKPSFEHECLCDACLRVWMSVPKSRRGGERKLEAIQNPAKPGPSRARSPHRGARSSAPVACIDCGGPVSRWSTGRCWECSKNDQGGRVGFFSGRHTQRRRWRL